MTVRWYEVVLVCSKTVDLDRLVRSVREELGGGELLPDPASARTGCPS